MRATITTLFLSVIMSFGQFGQAQTCSAGFSYIVDSTNQSVAFLDTSVITGHTITYAWDFGDGYSGPHQNPTHIYVHPGVYYVCLTVTADTPYCTSTICDSIVIPHPPVSCNASFSYYPSVHTNIINFNDLSTSGLTITSWTWDFGDSTFSNLENPSHHYADTGTYYVCLIISDAHGMCTDTFCHSVIVNTNISTCTAAFTSLIDSSGNVVFTNTSTGTGPHTNYHWNFGDGHGSTIENPFNTYFHPGTYYVCLTITDSTCSDTYCDSIHIPHPAAHTCHADFQYQLLNQSVNFNDLSTGSFLNYIWDFGDGHGATTANPNHQYADTGQYVVCLYISNQGCHDSICQTIYIHHFIHCQASFTVSVDTTTGTFNFINTSSISATDFLWTFGDGDSSTLQNPSHIYSISGNYTVCLFIHDSVSGCSSHNCYIFHNHHAPHQFALSTGLFPDEIASGINEVSSDFSLRCYPNPFSNITTIEYNLITNSKVNIQLYNLIGEMVMTLPAKNEQTGLHYQELNSSQLNAGIYLLKITVDNKSALMKIIVIK